MFLFFGEENESENESEKKNEKKKHKKSKKLTRVLVPHHHVHQDRQHLAHVADDRERRRADHGPEREREVAHAQPGHARRRDHAPRERSRFASQDDRHLSGDEGDEEHGGHGEGVLVEGAGPGGHGDGVDDLLDPDHLEDCVIFFP